VDQAIVQEIVQALARELSTPHWASLILTVVLTSIGAAVAAYYGAYLSEKGKNFATKEEFAALASQLRSNTTIVEDIKSEFGQRDWARREFAALRRTKLEELIAALYACRKFVEDGAFHVGKGELLPEPERFDAGSLLAALYFPELSLCVHGFMSATRQTWVLVLESTAGAQAVKDAKGDYGAALRDFTEKYRTQHSKLCERLAEVEREAGKLMRKITGADELEAKSTAASAGLMS